MFADELKSNTQRKRQEQNRQRRKQHLINKQKKQQQGISNTNVPAAPLSTTTASVLSSATAATSDAGNSTAPTVVTVTSIAPSSTVNAAAAVQSKETTAAPTDAVTKAKIEREKRQVEKLRQSSAIKIQSIYRCYRSNNKIKETETTALTKKLSDIGTLRTIIMNAKKTIYVVPPSMATSIAQEILFVTRKVPYEAVGRKKDDTKTATIEMKLYNDIVELNSKTIKSISNIIDFVLLPGMASQESEDLDPILPWLQSKEGYLRFKRFIQLCLVAVTSTSTTNSSEDISIIFKFLRVILGVESNSNSMTSSSSACSRKNVVEFTRSFLLLPSSSSLDLIKILRYHLLFNTSGRTATSSKKTTIIPPDSEKLRENCIPSNQRDLADMLFTLTFDSILSLEIANGDTKTLLQSQFVQNILTVPLLSWKVSSLSISKLLHVSTTLNSSKQGEEETIFIIFLRSFISIHSLDLSNGNVVENEDVLPYVDVPLTICPATNTQCLLANLLQIGRIIPNINGSSISKVNSSSGGIFFNLIATLLDVIPLGTLSTNRGSDSGVVEWIKVDETKDHYKPIILSPIIIEQCKFILVDSYVRDLFTTSMHTSGFESNVDTILNTKNDKDLKYEKDFIEKVTSSSTSAATLAANEARIDRTKSWFASKWAKQIQRGVKSLLQSDANGSSNSSTKASADKDSTKSTGLINTSSISRKIAKEGNSNSKSLLPTKQKDNKSKQQKQQQQASNDPSFFFALCRTYGIALARWGGGGKEDIVNRASTSTTSIANKRKQKNSTTAQTQTTTNNTNNKHQHHQALGKADPCALSLLNVICFSTDFVRMVWSIIQSDSKVYSDLYHILDDSSNTHRQKPIRSLSIRPSTVAYQGSETKTEDKEELGRLLLYIFLCTFSHTLIITDDVEIHDMDKPIPLHQVRRCLQILKKLLYRVCCIDDVVTATVEESSSSDSSEHHQSNYFGLALISLSSKTMRDLYDRSSRRPLCLPKYWLIEDLLEKDIRQCKTHEAYVALLSTPVLRICPYLVSFKRRLKLFERIVTTSRINMQGCNERQTLKPGITVRITRGRVLEDGLLTLNKLGPDLRQRIVVQYQNEAGTREAGVDVGGLFKEFWTDLSSLAFDPNYALFKVTESSSLAGTGNCLYPNPSSSAAHGSDHIILFEFLGRVLGKALYEGITIHPQFAHFFLSFLRGDYNFLHMLPDLSTMDSQLYNNLMFLKTYDGNAEDLCLTFTVSVDDFGGNREVPLIPNGSMIEVTNSNKQRYIGLVAKHHVCDRVREQSQAFTRGLWDVIDRSWLQLFNEPELQVLISGSSDGKIDIADMRSNTRYIGGYTGIDRTINRFWNVVSNLSAKQQGDLLRFVTSCERPPPLGFASMNPPFTIQRVGILRDGNQLPTASTCFNTLKLPTYSNEKVLKQRLVYAIESGAGFELT